MLPVPTALRDRVWAALRAALLRLAAFFLRVAAAFRAPTSCGVLPPGKRRSSSAATARTSLIAFCADFGSFLPSAVACASARATLLRRPLARSLSKTSFSTFDLATVASSVVLALKR